MFRVSAPVREVWLLMDPLKINYADPEKEYF